MSAVKSDYLRYIRESISLSDVCSKLGLSINGRGTQMRVLCPFHNDRTPSLHIYQDHYHCFVCQAHGDIFSLIQKVNGVDFKGAIAWAEEQFPFVLGQKPIKSPGRKPDRPAEQIALDYYAAEHSRIPYEIAVERGYTPEFLREAEVYGTEGNVLCAHATREEQDGLLQAQLIQRDYQASPDDISPYHDYFFKKRLLFTLRDTSRRVVGFAGRSWSEDDKPKYLYTRGLPKDTLLYRMDTVSARWDRAGEDTGDFRLYVVEGLFDALRLEYLGMDAVAVLGSRLTSGQLRILEEFVGQQRQRNRAVELCCFLDSDKAGAEGTYQMLRSVWRSDVLRDAPLSIMIDPQSILSEDKTEKDPDGFLNGLGPEQASAWLEAHRLHPMEFLLRRFIDRDTLAFDAHSLEGQWEQLSFVTRVRILNQIDNLFSGSIWRELLGFYSDLAGQKDKCFAVILLDQHLRGQAHTSSSGTVKGAEERHGSPYPLALEMARTGYRQEPMSLDDASWDRLSAGIELVGRAFDDMLPYLRQLPPDRPLLAFNTPKDADQDRLKALPDHEELLLQHYLLNELLQEDIFPGYARSVPAVRYDPLVGGTYTTGQGYMDTFQGTDYKAVSFAYQVDMPVLRGERRPSNGLFRHYYDCWKDFISFLRDGIDSLEGENIYRVKLDIRGYYDNIRKYSVRDVLIGPLMEAFGYSQTAFRRLKREDDGDENRQKQAEKIIDILLDRLFGWTYLDPQTGERRQVADLLLGIPQGPALSAYAANVLLFPLDRQVSQYIEQINSSCEAGYIRARYARYVDDMVILASDPAVLADIEEMIHTYLRSIELELSPKTDHADAVDKEEARWWLLDERGGLGVSAAQLAPEDTLNELWGSGYEPYVVNRHDALNILKGAADILAESGRFDEAFTACFRTENVRYRDASRLAALLLEHLLTSDSLSGSLYDAFTGEWRRERQQMGVLRSILSRQDVEPLAFLEGLLVLLQRGIPATLPAEEQASRQRVRQAAARQTAMGICIQQAELAYQDTDGKNTAFLSVKVLQLNALAQIILRSQDDGTQKGQFRENTPQKKYSSNLERYLQRWRYMILSAQSASVWEKRPPFFGDFPEDESDDFQLFHHLTACLDCCTERDWFRELGSLFLGHTRPGSSAAPKIRQIEQIWFQTGKTADAVSLEYARLALQTLSNFLQQDYLSEVVSQNPVMRIALFPEKDLNYLPVPPVPRQESSYPGIFAVRPDAAYRADVIFHEETWRSVQAVDDLHWSPLSDPVSDRWVPYCAGFGDNKWNALRSPIEESAEQWTPLLAEKIADLYEMLRSFLRQNTSGPILSKYHLFLSRDGRLHALTYYHDGWAEPPGIALAGSSRFLKWVPIDKGPGKADRAAALLLEDLLDLQRFPVQKGPAGNLLEVLSYGLGRLTGYRMQAYLSALSENSFAWTVQRTLDTWRLFAKASPEQERYVLLEVALTDRLMSARLGWEHSSFRPGEDSVFLERWAVTTIQNELLRLNELLPKLPADPFLNLPLRRGTAAWRDIGRRLLNIEGAGFDAIHALGCSALLRAVCLDIRMRTLECVWAMDDGEMRQLQARPLPLSLLEGQTEHAVLLLGSERSQQEQAERLHELMDRYHSGCGSYQLEQITPAGWYLLLAWVLELDGQDAVSRRLHPEHWENCGKEARAIWDEVGTLLFPKVSDAEDTPFPYSGLKPLLTGCGDTDRILMRLHHLDEMLNFEIRHKHGDTLSFGRRSQLMTQVSIRLESAATMSVPPQFVSFLHDGTQMPEYEGTNEERVWTQTMLSDRVLGVSVVARKAANLAWGESCLPLTEEDVNSYAPCEAGETVGSAPEYAAAELVSEQPATDVPPGPELAAPEQMNTETPSGPELAAPEQPDAGVPITPDLPSPGGDVFPDPLFWDGLKRCQNEQQHSWASRQNLNANVDRIAFFQFDVDDSYVHPLAECCTDNMPSLLQFKQNPADWDREQAKQHRKQLYSCSEYRRRKLLEAVFSVCDQFKVDILLLPEYSVRMETVQWMLERIKKCRYQFSVWAGTCRLTPGRNYESETLKELERESEDYKAILPIICTKPVLPFECDLKQEYPLLNLKRFKKYPSISMEELINPHDRELIPVMKDPGQLGGRLYGDARDDVMELICAEVFLASNPGNITAFAQVYDMLQKRFYGISAGIKAQMNYVRTDLQIIGEHTSLVQMKSSYPWPAGQVGNGPGKYGRTPILLVPAYTTRTVDYYVTGQAGYLATGLTMVFCNAVGLSSRGESCFIGTDCWDKKGAEKSPFMPGYTPYHGALPGIYRQYDTKEGHGALGKEEQALVICDINPAAASGGRPRPESMLQPLTLVAHLPVIESVTYRRARQTKDGGRCGPYDQCRCGRRTARTRDTSLKTEDKVVIALRCLIARLNEFDLQKRDHKTTAYDGKPDELADALEKLGIALKSSGLKERADCYRRFHRSDPQALPPATLLDWVWVDLDFPEPGIQEKAGFLNVPEFKGVVFQEPNW